MKLLRLTAILALAASPALLVAACSAGVEDPAGPTSASGVTSTTSSSSGAGGGAGGGEVDAGSDANMQPDVMVDCTDGDDCNQFDDTCNEGVCINGQCQKSGKDFSACNDNDPCTENDACLAGVCVGGTPKFCDATDPCHVGYCNPATGGCDFLAGNEGAQCDDGSPCTYQGVCSSGVCLLGVPIDCSLFDSQCAVGVCDQVTGCHAVPTNENGGCDDNQYCTINDKCVAGSCAGVANSCTAPGDVCMIGSCDEGLDKCVAVPGNDGGACDDGNLCTSGETCASGLCQGGVPANNGVLCDDANGCTAGDHLRERVCTGAASTISQCIDADSCCPPGCTDSDCLFWTSGIQQNLPEAQLTGWTLCFSDDYGSFNTPLSTVKQQCDKAKLLIGCKPAGSNTLTLAGMGLKDDVYFDCGTSSNCKHDANGVGFYYSDQWSWGFAPTNSQVVRNSCDVGAGFDNERMCWHTGGGSMNNGYRCGNNYPFDQSWQRVVYEAD
jgi:hypothetical protein